MSGYQVSALRAYLMTAIMLVAVLIDRPAISLRNLSVAAILIWSCSLPPSWAEFSDVFCRDGSPDRWLCSLAHEARTSGGSPIGPRANWQALC